MGHPDLPHLIPVREQADVIRDVLEQRLESVLPMAMQETGLDAWIVLCQEDNLDPVLTTLIPMDTWCPILQMFLFFLRDDGRVERINLSMTNTRGLYEQPWRGRDPAEQWTALGEIIQEREPKRIGINTGSVQWAAGGLTHNLYLQLVEALPAEYVERLESAETLATRWLATLTDRQIELHEQVAAIGHALLAECYSPAAITPGVTTTSDLEWHYWQRTVDSGLGLAFRPFFVITRSDAARDEFGEADRTIRSGDLIRSDVGIKYLGLNSDHQQVAYVLRPGEVDAPEGLRALLREGNRLQDIFIDEFQVGLTGNELLAAVLERARGQGVPNPRVYSHSLGHLLHEPGPLIGLPWEQERCEGRGDVKLEHSYSFTMELSVAGPVPEWDGQEVLMGLEEDVVFTEDGCRLLDGRQEEFYLI